VRNSVNNINHQKVGHQDSSTKKQVASTTTVVATGLRSFTYVVIDVANQPMSIRLQNDNNQQQFRVLDPFVSVCDMWSAPKSAHNDVHLKTDRDHENDHTQL